MPVLVAQELTNIGGDIKRMHLETLYQIGEKLAQAKAKLHEYKKSGWNQWVEEYTTVSRVYADQAIDVYEMGKNATNLLHTDLSNTTLIKMAKPSTPETARLQIAECVRNGERLDGKAVDTIIQTAKEVEQANKEAQELEAQKADIQKEIRDLELKRETATTLRKKAFDKSIAAKQAELESIKPDVETEEQIAERKEASAIARRFKVLKTAIEDILSVSAMRSTEERHAAIALLKQALHEQGYNVTARKVK